MELYSWGNKKNIASEDELWSLANFFFSDSCKKTSTYKFGFLKSIMDSLFSGELSNRGYELSFHTLFSRFAENYWNLVTKYHLKQMRYNGIEMQLYPEARKMLKKGIAVRFDRMVPRGDVCYTMRVLISAMEERRRIRFQYEIFDRHFHLIPKHDGQWYDISSYRFHFDDNTVYVYAGDATAGKKKTFRIERMVGVFMSDETNNEK